MKSTRVSVSLPKDQHQQIQELAENSNLSVSWIIRQAVSEFLKENESPQRFNPLIKKTPQGKS